MKRLVKDLEKLRAPAEPLEFITNIGIEKEEGEKIISEIIHVMESKNLIALSAPAIGIKKRIFCIRFNDIIKTFINPIITKKSGIQFTIETFANMPGDEIFIARPKDITVVYYNSDFKYEDNKLLDSAASIFCQQCELLDGILPSDLGLVSNIESDGSLNDVTEEEMGELIEFYKEYIKTKQKSAMSEITEEEMDNYKKLKFTEDVINDRIQVIENKEDVAPCNRAQRRQIDKLSKQVNKKRRK